MRPNLGSRSGICEFNARKARAQSSLVSISGEINTGVDAVLRYAVPTQGRTVRVGTPIVPNRQIPKRNLPAERPEIKPQNPAQSAPPKPTVKQRVERLPIPQAKYIPTPANHQAPLLSPPRPYPPQISQRPQALPRTQIAPANPGTQNLERQFYRQQMLVAQRRAAEQAYARNYAPPQFQRGYYSPQPQAQQPQPQQYQVGRPQTPAPVRMAPAQANRPQMNRPQAYGPQPQSLYGSLHDDLTKNMTPVPRPQTAPDYIDNPDAPLSTSRSLNRSGSRATPPTPVETAPLERPAFAELAGGR